MARNARMARLMAVANALASSRRGAALATLADRNGWALRALYRDIDALEQAGIPIIHEGQRYRIAETWRSSMPMGADPEELMALFVAREQAAGWRATSLGKALERLWSKASGSPKDHAGHPHAPHSLAIRPPLAIDYAAHRGTIETIERALCQRHAVNCTYRAVSTGEETTRVVEPGELYWDPGLESLYLIGYCRLRRDLRVFAVHRFRAVSESGEKIAKRPGINARQALRDAFRMWREATTEQVRIRFSPAMAGRIQERKWHASQTIKPLEGGGVELSLEVAGLEEIRAWVLGFGADARVVEPPRLVEAVRAELGDALAGYGKRVISQ